MKRTCRAKLLTRLCIAGAIYVCSIASTAEGTAQFSDLIVIEGRSEQLFTEPLEPALHADPELQYKLMMRIPGNGCSASWRGYVAGWEIRTDELYLVDVQVDPCANVKKMVPLAELFPGAIGPVKAQWFTGTLTGPQGQQLEYVHMGYGSRYERYLLLDIVKGNVTSSTLTSGRANSGAAH
jgi:hypothetical protein